MIPEKLFLQFCRSFGKACHSIKAIDSLALNEMNQQSNWIRLILQIDYLNTAKQNQSLEPLFGKIHKINDYIKTSIQRCNNSSFRPEQESNYLEGCEFEALLFRQCYDNGTGSR